MIKRFIITIFIIIAFAHHNVGVITDAHAQPQLTNAQLLQGLIEGELPLDIVANEIAEAAEIDIDQATSILENIQNVGELDFAESVTLLNDLTNGQIDVAMAEALSGIPLLSNQELLQGLFEGELSLNTVAEEVASLAGIDIEQATSILENIQNISEMNFEDAVSLVNDLTNGQIDAAIAETLSSIPDLGELEEISEIIDILESGEIIDELVQQFTELGTEALQEQIGKIIEIAGGSELLEEILSGEGLNEIAEAVSEALEEAIPELGEIFGGLNALTPEAISEAIEQMLNISATPGSANVGACNIGCNGDQNKGPPSVGESNNFCDGIGDGCQSTIEDNHEEIREHVTEEFVKHREWLENTFWRQHFLPAITKMNLQFSIVAMQQVSIIGQFFDAKHQLETQRLLQELSAQSYKDYTPSEGLCEFGTNTISLAASAQKSNLAYQVIANRQIDRSIRAKDTISSQGPSSDKTARRAQFVFNYCDKANNSNGLKLLCKNGTAQPHRFNKDIDYTRTFSAPLTLNMDMSVAGTPTEEAEDVFALSANLYAHDVMPQIPARRLANGAGFPRQEAYDYMDFRAIAAKRSVAMNNFAAIAGLKASGDEKVARFLKRVVTELGVPDEEVNFVLGETPSYHAQMEVLTKKLYQNPVFYTELYDKPANVRRKGVTMRAISLMQERDIYNSLLRSEATLAVTLETMLYDEQQRVRTTINTLPIVESRTDMVDR